MKGLLLKDVYSVVKHCKLMLFVVIPTFMLVSLIDHNTAFFSFFCILLCETIPVTVIAYDEKSKWHIFCDTLPYTRKLFVTSKYIMSLFSIITPWLLISITQIIVNTFSKSNKTSDLIGIIVCTLSLGIIFSSLLMPLIFKMGTEKGRIAHMAIIMLFSILGAITASFISDNNVELSFVPFIGFLLPISIVLFISSWFLSVKFYEKREL